MTETVWYLRLNSIDISTQYLECVAYQIEPIPE